MVCQAGEPVYGEGAPVFVEVLEVLVVERPLVSGRKTAEPVAVVIERAAEVLGLELYVVFQC